MKLSEIIERLRHLAVREEDADDTNPDSSRSYAGNAVALREAIRMLDAYATEKLK